MNMKMTMLAMAVLVLAAAQGRAETFKIDPAHSSVEFRVRHLVGKVSGKFGKFEGTFDYEPGDAKAWKAEAVIDAASIDTGVGKRDDHLRAEDFFAVKEHPTIVFKSRKVSAKGGKPETLHGELTMRGITRKIALALEFGGVAKDPWGNRRAGVTARATIKRKDFGLNWNQALETGGLLVGEDVDIVLEIEGIAAK